MRVLFCYIAVFCLGYVFTFLDEAFRMSTNQHNTISGNVGRGLVECKLFHIKGRTEPLMLAYTQIASGISFHAQWKLLTS